MALSAAAIAQAVLLSAQGQGFNGISMPALAAAIGQGTYAWVVVPANLALNGVSTGTVGNGAVSGTLTVIPNVPLVLASMNGAGINGIVSPALATAIALGIATVFTTQAQYQGVSIGVGSGVDASTITTANPVTLAASILASMVSAGVTALPLATGLANGITGQLLGSVGVGVVVGPPGPPGPPGVTTSSVL